MAIKLNGIWREGYALDMHSISSELIGTDEYGHKKFKTTRTEIGQLLYQLKYKFDKTVLDDIINKAVSFIVNEWKVDRYINLIIPIPPSNTDRSFQPVLEISKGIAKKLDILIDEKALTKTKRVQTKDLSYDEKEKALSDAIKANHVYKREFNVLLIDDLFDSGSTLNAVTSILQKKDNIKNIYVLTMTKTRG